MKPASLLLILLIGGAVLFWLLSKPGSPSAPLPAASNSGPLMEVSAMPADGESIDGLKKQIAILEGQIEYLQGQNKALQDENTELIDRLGSLGLKNGGKAMSGQPAVPLLAEPEDRPADYVSLEVELLVLRQLPSAPVPVVPASLAEVEKAILAWLRKLEPGDSAPRQAKAFAALGLIPQEIDPLPLRAALLAKQLGGWFDGEQQTIHIIETEPGSDWQPDPVLALAYAQAVRFHGETLFAPDAKGPLSTDAMLARHALLGGDAALSRFLLSLKKPIPVGGGGLPAEDPDHPFNQIPLPVFYRELQLFPFNRGFEFAQSLHSAGGMKQAGSAFGRPPASCAEIIDPVLYLSQHPPPAVKIEWSDLAVLGSQPVWDDSLGKFAVYAALKSYCPDAAAFDAADGWQADRVLAFDAGGGNRGHAVWQLAFPDAGGASRFFKAMRSSLLQRYEQPEDDGKDEAKLELSAQGRFVRLSINRQGSGVLLIEAANEAFAKAAAEKFDPPPK